MKKILWGLCAIIVVIAAVLAGYSFYMLDYALDNSARQHHMGYESIARAYPETRPWLDSLSRTGQLRDTFVVMPNGERQHALYVRSQRAHGRTAIVVHGYTDRAVRMLQYAYIYNDVMGYNVLLPDLHAHGESDGDDIQMGWKDRLDVLHWTRVAEKAFRTQGDTSRVVLHGISMGAATVMCLSGEDTPSYVRCFVEDCGFTSAWDEFAGEMQKRYQLPEFPLLYSTSLLCRLKYGWSFGQASAVEQVKKCVKPMLFIHGGNDTFVPTAMVYRVYEAKPQPKQLWIAPRSGHALSYRDHKQEYISRVRTFVEPLMR